MRISIAYPILSAAVWLILAGCTSPDRQVSMPVQLAQRGPRGGTIELQQQWWLAFEDEELDRVIRRSLAGNFSLAQAWNRLDAARAVARREGADLWPQVDVGAAGSRTRTRRQDNTTYTTSYLGQLLVGYEVDLWGRIRSTRQAAILDARGREQDVQAAAITLSASVAATWVQLAESLGQEQLLAEQTQTNQQLLELFTQRFRQGRVQAIDVLRQRQLLESTRSLAALASQRSALLKHQLALLQGLDPATELPWPEDLPELSPLPVVDDAMSLLKRRPDVRSARLAVAAQDQRLAAAIAAQYPRLSLSASLETSASNAGDLFEDWLARLAGNLAHPLFDGGRLGAEVDRNRNRREEVLNAYGQTVLEALAEVEDALAREAWQRRYVQSLRKQLETADELLKRTRASYLNGQVDYLRVLDAVTSRQQTQRQLLQARRDLVGFRIQLYRSLAGDIPLERPTPGEALAGDPREQTDSQKQGR